MTVLLDLNSVVGVGRYDAAEARLKTLAIVGQALVYRVARATLLRATG